MHELIYATLRLFHAVPLLEAAQGAPQEPDNAAHLRHGFFLTQRAVDSCPVIETPRLLKFIERQFGYDVVAMNRGFHKNFHEVADASTDELFIEQMLHYFSVYLQNGDMTDDRPINESLVSVFHSCLKLRIMLEKAGARFEKPEGVPWDIDLSLDQITKDSILALFPSTRA